MKHVGKDGTYTIEEESATDKIWAQIKYQKIIDKWFKILCPFIDWQRYYSEWALIQNKNDPINEDTLKIEIINQHIEALNEYDNNNRSFGITVTEV
jgi:hypothetical protein